jgi:hypothetical protein
MPQIVTAIDIDAPPSTVFTVLSETHRYGAWNPFTKRVYGNFKKGSHIAFVALVAGKKVPIDARVTEVTPNKRIAWRGPYLRLLDGLAHGEHTFELEDLGDGKTRLFHTERFGGLLPNVETIWTQIEGALAPTYETFNLALKRESERRAH